MDRRRDILLWTGLAAASVLLAMEPVAWVITTWADPSYQSNGALFGLALLGLVLLSLASSPRRPLGGTGSVLLPFLCAAGLRFLGQSLAINILSALALAVDVYAIALFLRLDRRRFALSPFWLAVFFLFALPLGPILQRVAGFPLQMISAELACAMLSPVFSTLVCEGVRLKVETVDVMVDLPCSGASGLLLMVSLWAFLNVILRPRLGSAAFGLILITLLALAGNALRISLLAGGLALGIDTMAPALHESIGLATTALAAILSLVLYRPKAAPPPLTRRVVWHLPRRAHLPAALCALAAALAITNAPRSPIDVSAPVQAAVLPGQINGYRALPIPLSPTEARYFTAYGGTAQKVQYGPLGLNLVRSASPLRHLHAPETCLRGLGFEVAFKGTVFDPIATSIYEAKGPDGRVWTVAVSFVSDDGQVTAGVGEAVWSWLSGASRNWQSIQRITPATLSEPHRHSFERAALAALDLT
ncbi:MAG: exosortase T [Silicimonas sp.]|nr:exosortase T [Silicimonas sp.]